MATKKCWAVFHNNPKSVAPTGGGYVLKRDSQIETLWYVEADALAIATELASKNPGTQVVILEAKTIIEAKKPDTFAKTWKDNGELIPSELKKFEKFDPENFPELRMNVNIGDVMPAGFAPAADIRWDQPQQAAQIQGLAEDVQLRPQPVRRGR